MRFDLTLRSVARELTARTPYSCLIIERDGAASGEAAQALPRFGFRPFLADSPEGALGIARQWTFDAALVDADGFGPAYVDVLRRLRPAIDAPVILLSKAQNEAQQIVSLESGATEVVIKPASPRLLAAKMQRLIEVVNRSDARRCDDIRVGPLSMLPGSGLATVGGIPIALTAQQFELLYLLASEAGRFVARDAIALRLRGQRESIGRSTDVHVYRIRRRLRDSGIAGLRLDTVHGRGYMLTLVPAVNGADAAETARPARPDRPASARGDRSRPRASAGDPRPGPSRSGRSP